MRSLKLSLSAAVALATLATTCRAQVPGMMGQNAPPISPYIGLLRAGASPGINWANIVMPQVELYNATNQLQGQQNVLGSAVGGMSNAPTTTGHPVLFGSFLQFYNSRGVLASGMMGGMGMGGMGGTGMGGMGMGGMGMGGMGMGGMGMGGMGMGGMGMGGMMGGMGGMMGGMGGGMMGGVGGMGGSGYAPPGR